MAAFVLRCPKCSSTRVEGRRDIRTRWGGYAKSGVPVLHCSTCGKEVYGAAAEEEVARQVTHWEAVEEAARTPPGPSPQELKLEEERRRAAAEEKAHKGKARREHRRATVGQERIRREAEHLVSVQAPVPLEPGRCGWRECVKDHTDWSKYCSVDCRHKSARWTYDVKQGRVKERDAA